MTSATLVPAASTRSSHRAVHTAGITPALPGLDPAALERSFAVCQRVVAARARNFYYGLRLTPEPRRSAVYAIYAWMRAGDDAVDAQTDAAAQRRALHDFRERTRVVLGGIGGPAEGGGENLCSGDSFWPAFAATVHSYNLDRAHLDGMLAGLEEDLTHAQYATDLDLERYCHRVASTVGLVCVQIWGVREGLSSTDAQRIPDLAARRGQAFQLTNILRDFREDYDASPPRVYLSRESFARAGLTAQALRAWTDDAACRAYVLQQGARARDHFQASADLDAMIDPACRPTLWAMTRIYAGLLDMILADPSRVVSPRRIRLPSWKKAAIAVRAMIGRLPG